MKFESKKQSALFLKLTEASPDAIILADAHFDIIFCNNAACRLFGYTSEELLGSNCLVLVPEDLKGPVNAFLADLDRIYNSRGSIVETRCVHKSGREIPIETSNFLFELKNRVVFATIFHDITRRKQIEKELKQEQIFLQKIFDTAMDGLMISDDKGEIIRCNRSLQKMLGCSEESILKMHPDFFYGKSAQSKRPEIINKLFTEGCVRNYQTACETVAGERIDFEINMVVMKNGDEDIVGAVSSIRDISERKKQEQEQEKIIKKLKKKKIEVKKLKGLLPLCSWCKKIRDDNGYWHQLESYIASQTKAVVTHGICPECAERVNKELEESD